MATSSTIPPPPSLLSLTSLVPLRPQSKVSPSTIASLHLWKMILGSSHSKACEQDGRSADSQTPREQGRLKVLGKMGALILEDPGFLTCWFGPHTGIQFLLGQAVLIWEDLWILEDSCTRRRREHQSCLFLLFARTRQCLPY